MAHAADNRNELEQVRAASDIAEVVGEHVSLKPKGREFVGLCPFHDDRRPSMAVVPSKQIFKCFACGAGGDVFGFVMRYHGMDFPEALKYLAERAGIELRPRRADRGAAAPAGSPVYSKRDIVDANAAAAAFFRAIFEHESHGAAAREAAERRGFDAETIEAFGIGASPDRWDGLVQWIASKGLDESLFIEAGLLKKRDNGGCYDAMRNRLIFPIRDQIGRAIAFGGRRINDEDEPKYLNSPESALFSKSTALFGIDRAARAIQAERTAVVVEGYTDVIACHRAGVCNVVGTLGTALTTGHAVVLRRLCERVVLLFDGDEAGRRAADRAMEVLFAEDIDIQVARLDEATDAKDPDELLARPHGVDVFRRVIDNARDVLEVRFAALAERLRGAGPAAVARGVRDELQRLGEIGLASLSPVRRRLVLRRIAEAAGVPETDVRGMAPAARNERRADLDLPASPRLGPAERALGCLLARPVLWTHLSSDARELVLGAAYGSPMAERVAAELRHMVNKGPIESAGLNGVLAVLTPEPEAASAAVGLERAASTETDDNEERMKRLLDDCVRRLELAASDGGMPQSASSDDAASLASRLAALRDTHKRLGGNPAARLMGD